jgi:hypothetical protein
MLCYQVVIIYHGFHLHKFFHWLYSPLVPWPLIFSSMIILQSVGLLGRVNSSSQGLYLNTGQHKHRINTYTYQTSMPCGGFEPTIPVSVRAKTVHSLDHSATVTGFVFIYYCKWLMHFIHFTSRYFALRFVFYPLQVIIFHRPLRRKLCRILWECNSLKGDVSHSFQTISS